MAYTLADVAEPPVKKVYKLEDVAPAAEQNPNAFAPQNTIRETVGTVGENMIGMGTATPPITNNPDEFFSNLPAVAQPIMKTFTPPTSLQDAMIRKPAQLEEMGKQVKSAVKGAIGNTAKDFPKLKKVGQIATDFLPFTPSEFSAQIAGETVFSLLSDVAKTLPKGIANRFFRQPPSEALSRMESGKPPLGEEVLSSDDLKNFRVQDKKKIYKMAQERIAQLGEQVDEKITAVLKKGLTANKGDEFIGPQTQKLLGAPEAAAGPVIEPEIVDPRTIGKKLSKTGSYDYVTTKNYTGSVGGGDALFDQPYIGQSLPPDAKIAGFQTAAQPFKNGGARGVFNPETDAAIAKQAEYIRQARRESLDTMAKLKTLKENGFKIKQGPAIPKDEIIDSGVMSNVLKKMLPDFEELSPDRKTVDLLKKVQNAENLDFKTANELREVLGREINRKFLMETERLSPLTEAQRAIYTSLRRKIGEISPELSTLLEKQHALYEVSNAVGKDAAKGFTNYSGAFDYVAKNMKTATLVNFLLNQKGVGDLGASTLGKLLTKKENQQGARK